MSSPLPDGFSDLEPWIDWAQPTELARNHKRWSASMAVGGGVKLSGGGDPSTPCRP